ncbi:MAG: hypothetical protein HOF34_06215, partial [Rhodospirillaceae bacterium]|nr:hypothetical protein [Rhodospirillaceae bacterium]
AAAVTGDLAAVDLDDFGRLHGRRTPWIGFIILRGRLCHARGRHT